MHCWDKHQNQKPLEKGRVNSSFRVPAQHQEKSDRDLEAESRGIMKESTRKLLFIYFPEPRAWAGDSYDIISQENAPTHTHTNLPTDHSDEGIFLN